jgi:hypothetical protein
MLKMAAGFGDFPLEIVSGIAEVIDASHPLSLLAWTLGRLAGVNS